MDPVNGRVSIGSREFIFRGHVVNVLEPQKTAASSGEDPWFVTVWAKGVSAAWKGAGRRRRSVRGQHPAEMVGNLSQ